MSPESVTHHTPSQLKHNTFWRKSMYTTLSIQPSVLFFFLSLPFQPFLFSHLLLSLRTCIPIFVILAQLLQKKSTLRNPNVLFFWRSCPRMLIFGSYVHKAKLTLHAKIRCHRPTFFSKRYLRVFGHGFLFLKASLILLLGAEHVFRMLQAPTPPPLHNWNPTTLNKKYVHNT